MKRLCAWFCMVVLAASAAVAAKSEGDRPKRERPPMDAEKVFAAHDTNGDKAVTVEELINGPLGKRGDKEKVTARFEKMDRDGDKKLTLDELKAHAERMAARAAKAGKQAAKEGEPAASKEAAKDAPKSEKTK